MKLTFNIQDIPEGSSSTSYVLKETDLDLEPYKNLGGVIALDFNRTLYFIQVKFTVDIDVELVCDRSLKSFIYNVNRNFEVLFKVGVEKAKAEENCMIRPFDFDSLELNIEQDVRDTVLLDIPAKKIHPDYIDEDGSITNFETQKFGKQAVENDTIDPRWEKLKKLKNKN